MSPESGRPTTPLDEGLKQTVSYCRGTLLGMRGQG
jgi:hypothetical protein